MIENYRSGLLWKLFMSCDEVQQGLQKLDFQRPYTNSRFINRRPASHIKWLNEKNLSAT